jgi:Rod binding domain-containing protein
MDTSASLLASSAPTGADSAQQLTPARLFKLHKAATEFESMLLANWWKSMKESGFAADDSTDPGHDTLDQLGIQALSSAVASAGGLGIASMLVRGVLSNAMHRAQALDMSVPDAPASSPSQLPVGSVASGDAI